MPHGYGTKEDREYELLVQGAIDGNPDYEMFVVFLNKSENGKYSRKRITGIEVVHAKQIETKGGGVDWDFQTRTGSADFRPDIKYGGRYADRWLNCEHNKRFLASCFDSKLFQVSDPKIAKEIMAIYDQIKAENIKVDDDRKAKEKEIAKGLFGEEVTVEEFALRVVAEEDMAKKRLLERKQQTFVDAVGEYAAKLRQPKVEASVVEEAEEKRTPFDIYKMDNEELKKQIGIIKRSLNNENCTGKKRKFLEAQLESFQDLLEPEEEKVQEFAGGSIKVE